MRLLDTVALIAYLNPKDREHKRSKEYFEELNLEDSDIFIPNTSLIEADLLMKIRGYDFSEREVSWRALESRVPEAHLLTNSISSIYSALEFQEKGLDYFDSLITSLARETDSPIITTDKVIGTFVQAEW
ncbi:MAG: PIN domain-containing protein [Nitrososphaerota archaeon]|nr:PIN domain-containing protein [Nitrososphaerota archaeon]